LSVNPPKLSGISSSIEQINKTITLMDNVTQQVAALVEPLSSELAASLTHLVTRYQAGEGSAQNEARSAERPRSVPKLVLTVERRAASRPLMGGKGAVSAVGSRLPARVAHLSAAADDWKEF
jgi:methyl-accepting chemotaxis protein